MLIVAIGNNHQQRNSYVAKVLADLKVKRASATETLVEPHNATPDTVRELLSTNGLYDEKRIIVLKNLTDLKQDSMVDVKEWRSFFNEECALDMQASQHAFVFVAEESNKAVKCLQDKAHTFKEFVQAKKVIQKDNTVFLIANKFIEKDKKNCWKLFVEAGKKGIPTEEIHGILLWQLKALKEVLLSGDQKKTTLSPFVYTKTAKSAHLWQVDDVDKKLVLFATLGSGEERGNLSLYIEKMIISL